MARFERTNKNKLRVIDLRTSKFLNFYNTLNFQSWDFNNADFSLKNNNKKKKHNKIIIYILFSSFIHLVNIFQVLFVITLEILIRLIIDPLWTQIYNEDALFLMQICHLGLVHSQTGPINIML